MGRRGPLPFPLRLLPAANEYPIALRAVGVHAYTRCPPMPLIARYLPQSIDKRHKIGRICRFENLEIRIILWTRMDRCILMQMFGQRNKIEPSNCVYVSLRVYTTLYVGNRDGSWRDYTTTISKFVTMRDGERYVSGERW